MFIYINVFTSEMINKLINEYGAVFVGWKTKTNRGFAQRLDAGFRELVSVSLKRWRARFRFASQT